MEDDTFVTFFCKEVASERRRIAHWIACIRWQKHGLFSGPFDGLDKLTTIHTFFGLPAKRSYTAEVVKKRCCVHPIVGTFAELLSKMGITITIRRDWSTVGYHSLRIIAFMTED